MPLITLLGEDGIFLILLGIFFLLFCPTRRYGVLMLGGMLFGLLICNITLKPLIARTRPFDVQTAIELLVEKPLDFSFPSGHTNVTFICATVLFSTNRKLGIPALILASLVAFSRLYLYVHYPTDVLGGLLCGILTGLITVKLFGWLLEKYPRLQQFFQSEQQE